MDAWWQSGGVQNQIDCRRHDLSDGYCIPGPWSQPRTIPNYSTSSAQLRTESGSSYIELEANDIYWDIVSRNSRLIQSMTNEAAERVSNIVAEGQAAGMRSEDMADDILRQWPTMTRAHAKLIARTESSKAASALTRSRAQSAGLNWYIWETSEDSRVRSSHRHMDGVLVNWNDPPSPEALIDMKDYGKYHAGEFPNCRCYAAPLIEYDDVSWPHKVYRNGRIRYMRLSEFKKIEGG